MRSPSSRANAALVAWQTTDCLIEIAERTVQRISRIDDLASYRLFQNAISGVADAARHFFHALRRFLERFGGEDFGLFETLGEFGMRA